jgi:serine/threonine protein kinase
MAPEMCRQEKYDEKIDIWSLGITAIECAETAPPFYDLPPLMVLYKLANGLLHPSLNNPKKFSANFQDFLSMCLQSDQSKRASAKDLLAVSV